MANVIKCLTCGKNNPTDQEFCQFCQARLQPLTGNLKGEDKPLAPGQLPTKKITADLEPVLPQWLRDARSSARQSSEDDAAQTPQAPRPAFSGADLLAGLHSQAQDDEEEDTPDWLSNITGEMPKPKKTQAESSEVRWVELGDKKDFAQPEPDPDVPAWLSGITHPPAQTDSKDELTDWLRAADDSRKSQQASQPISFDTPPSTPATGETPDWLHSMVADDGAGFSDSGNATDESFTPSDTPDWLRAMAAENETPNANIPSSGAGTPSAFSDTPDWLHAMAAENEAPTDRTPSSGAGTPPAFSETPDWLRAMDAENTATKAVPPSSDAGTPSAFSETPDWLRAMDAENAAPKAVPPSSDAGTPSAFSDTPDWLRGLDAQDKTQSAASVVFSESGLDKSDAVFSSAGDTPDWLKGLGSDTTSSSDDQSWLKSLQPAESEKSPQDSTPAWSSVDVPATREKPMQGQPPAKDDAELDIPSWLKAAAPQSSIFTEPPTAQETPASTDTPDWLDTFKSLDKPQSQAEPAKPPPAFVDDAKPAADADALFTEMPDWLSVVDNTASAESIPTPITNVDAIAPGDLPSWVQAMRPVDAGVPQISTSLSGDKTPESRGALAGLQGVLPAAPGLIPTSKPKAYSIKLQASEEQLAHAGLLEQILLAETAPVPIDSFSALGTSRGLRWLLAFLFFVSLTAVLFMQTRIFDLPLQFPVEAVSALNIVNDSIPDDARVLVVFDYEPARAGEMEAIAVPIFDRLIRSRYPRLTFISTNGTGAVLAERFITSGPLAELEYKSGSQYLNLGYLPGGQMGIRAFAENPIQTVKYPFPQSSNLLDFTIPALAQAFPPLEGVSKLSQFSALILITDNADSARAWIEQTKSARGEIPVPLVVVSSAQAAPMIQPYYASHQISGLVSGLYGGVLFEQNNEGRSTTVRTYWDAYSIGMLLAMALILGGGLINLALGLRDRAAAREAK